MRVLIACMPHAYWVPVEIRIVSDPLERELQMLVSNRVSAGSQAQRAALQEVLCLAPFSSFARLWATWA